MLAYNTVFCLVFASSYLNLSHAYLFQVFYNGSQPFVSSAVRLHIMCWSRFFRSSGASLACAVDVEISGIPAHAWSLETVELLLDETCAVREVHPSTGDRRDIFWLSAWCVRP